MRFPKNYAGLKPELGAFLKQLRKQRGLRQKAVAFEVGINRVNLSRMENGHLTPSYKTLTKLMSVLEFEWSDVAVQGRAPHGNRRYLSSQLQRMGEELRAGRNAMGINLRDLAEIVDLSSSQLSRIERGLTSYSRVIKVTKVGPRPLPEDEDLDKDAEWRIYEFSHPELVRLARFGRDKLRS